MILLIFDDAEALYDDVWSCFFLYKYLMLQHRIGLGQALRVVDQVRLSSYGAYQVSYTGSRACNASCQNNLIK